MREQQLGDEKMNKALSLTHQPGLRGRNTREESRKLALRGVHRCGSLRWCTLKASLVRTPVLSFGSPGMLMATLLHPAGRMRKALVRKCPQHSVALSPPHSAQVFFSNGNCCSVMDGPGKIVSCGSHLVVYRCSVYFLVWPTTLCLGTENAISTLQIHLSLMTSVADLGHICDMDPGLWTLNFRSFPKVPCHGSGEPSVKSPVLLAERNFPYSADQEIVFSRKPTWCILII